MYELIFDKEPIQFLKKAPKLLSERIWRKILQTKENPYRFFERLSERSDYKLRVGDYRIIADINNANKVIQITLIEHRSKVYE